MWRPGWVMGPGFRAITGRVGDGGPFALATVVYAAGSAPQKAGARAVFFPDGRVLGTLGGGCMEAEARRRGLGLLSGGEPELFDLHLDDDFGWDDGLICGGSASILIQPMRRVDPAPFQAAIELQEARGRGVFCLLVSAPDPGLVGHTCLIRDGAAAACEIPCAAVRQAVEAAATTLLAEGREEPRRVTLKEL